MKIIEKIPKELLDATNEYAIKIEWSRRKPLYEVHKWWARRYSGIVRLFLIYTFLDYHEIENVKNYSKFVERIYNNPPRLNGFKLLDPFCGGGTIILEASRLGIKAYGIEINKLAYQTLETIKTLNSIDLSKLREQVISFAKKINREIWSTRCIKGHDAFIIHTFLVWKNSEGKQQIKYNKIKTNHDGTIVFYCENCDNIFKSKNDVSMCPSCGHSFNRDKSSRKMEYSELYPYAIEYYCPTCKTRDIKKTDKDDIERFNHKYSVHLYTQELQIPELNETKRLIKKGFKYFKDLLTPRQLRTYNLFLGMFSETPYKSIAEVMVSDSLRSCSLLAYYSHKYMKVIPAFVIKSFWLPIQPVELNPISGLFDDSTIRPLGRGNLISALRKIIKASNEIKKYGSNFHVYLGAAQDILKSINEKFDLIFTDPPYANLQYYSDLSLFSLSLLGKLNEQYLKYLIENEIVLRDGQLDQYLSKIEFTFKLAKDKLKDNGRILITFHHPNVDIIKSFISVLKTLGLNLDAVYPVIGESSGKLAKRKLYLDLLFVFSKKKRRNTYWVPTDVYFTKYDKMLVDSIKDIIEGYNER